MTCRRCSLCSINYPAGRAKCGVCGGELALLTTVGPDLDWPEAVERKLAELEHRRSTASQVEAWRLEQLLNAGYPLETAERLAELPWHQVDLHQAVDLACTAGHECAAAILL
jgi:hypothetical protein